MANIKDLHALAWKPLDTANINSIGAGARSMVSSDFAPLFDSIVSAVREYSLTYYGEASKQEKYVKIVNLLIKRITATVNSTFSDLVDTDISELITNNLDLIRTLIESIGDIDLDVNQIISEITDYTKLIVTRLLVVKSNEVRNIISNLFDVEVDVEDLPTVAKKFISEDDVEDENIKKLFDLKLTLCKILDEMISFITDNIDKTNTACIQLGLKVAKLTKKTEEEFTKQLEKEQLQKNIVSRALNRASDAAAMLLPNKKAKKILKMMEIAKKKIKNATESILSEATNAVKEFKKSAMKCVDELLHTLDDIFKLIVQALTLALISFVSTGVGPLILIAIVAVGILLRLIEPYIDKYFKPACSFLLKVIDTVREFVKKVILNIIGETLKTILEKAAPPLKKILIKLALFIAPVIRFIGENLAKIFDVLSIVVGALFDYVFIPLARALKGVARIIGEFVGFVLVSILDIATVILEAIKPYAKIVVEFLVFLAKVLLDILVAFVRFVRPIAEPLGIFFGCVLLAMLKILNVVMMAIKPVAYVLGFVLGILVVGLNLVRRVIIKILTFIFKLVNALFPILKLLLLPLKLIAKLAGKAFAFYVKVTLKFIRKFLGSWGVEKAREAGRDAAEALANKLLIFFYDITVAFPRRMRAKEDDARKEGKLTADPDALKRFLSKDAKIFDVFREIYKMNDMFAEQVAYFKDEDNIPYKYTIGYLYDNLPELLDRLYASGGWSGYDLSTVYDKYLESLYSKFDKWLGLLNGSSYSKYHLAVSIAIITKVMTTLDRVVGFSDDEDGRHVCIDRDFSDLDDSIKAFFLPLHLKSKKPELMQALMKDLYDALVKKYGKTKDNVLNGIASLIKDTDNLNESNCNLIMNSILPKQPGTFLPFGKHSNPALSEGE